MPSAYPPTQMLTRLRATPDPLLLLVGASCIGFANFYAYGAFSSRSLKLVAVGCIASAAAMALPALRVRYYVLVPQLAVVTLVCWQGLTLVRATAIYGAGHALSDARYLSIALPVVAAAAILTTGKASDWWWRALVIGFAVGCVATIRASPSPRIDVWWLVQHASDCILRGCDPYTLHTPRAPGLQTGFPYLPMTAVLLAPFKLLVHDVRYGEALPILVAAVVVRRGGPSSCARLAPLLLCVPGIFFEVEQAWVESLLVLLLVVPAALALRRRAGGRNWVWVGLALGVAVASKQHIALLLPVAALTLGARTAATSAVAAGALMLPWFVAGPHAFWNNTVRQFVDQPPRTDSLSMWLQEPAALRTALTLLVLAASYVIVWLCCRQHPHRFLLGSGLVLAAFDLMNKSSFYDQWILVTWLLVAGLAWELEHRGARVSIVTREV